MNNERGTYPEVGLLQETELLTLENELFVISVNLKNRFYKNISDKTRK